MLARSKAIVIWPQWLQQDADALLLDVPVPLRRKAQDPCVVLRASHLSSPGSGPVCLLFTSSVRLPRSHTDSEPVIDRSPACYAIGPSRPPQSRRRSGGSALARRARAQLERSAKRSPSGSSARAGEHMASSGGAATLMRGAQLGVGARLWREDDRRARRPPEGGPREVSRHALSAPGRPSVREGHWTQRPARARIGAAIEVAQAPAWDLGSAIGWNPAGHTASGRVPPGLMGREGVWNRCTHACGRSLDA